MTKVLGMSVGCKQQRKGEKNSKRKKAKAQIVGTRCEVWAGLASKTRRGLTKKDFMKTRCGKIVSKHMHQIGKEFFQNWGEPWKSACLKVCALRRNPMGTYIRKGTEDYSAALHMMRAECGL